MKFATLLLIPFLLFLGGCDAAQSQVDNKTVAQQINTIKQEWASLLPQSVPQLSVRVEGVDDSHQAIGMITNMGDDTVQITSLKINNRDDCKVFVFPKGFTVNGIIAALQAVLIDSIKNHNPQEMNDPAALRLPPDGVFLKTGETLPVATACNIVNIRVNDQVFNVSND